MYYMYTQYIYIQYVYIYALTYIVISYISMTKFKSLLKLIHVTIPGTFGLTKVLTTLRNPEISISAYNTLAFQFSVALTLLNPFFIRNFTRVLNSHIIHLLLFWIALSSTAEPVIIISSTVAETTNPDVFLSFLSPLLSASNPVSS